MKPAYSMFSLIRILILLVATSCLSARGATEIVARFPYSVTKIAYDNSRERLYLTSASANTVIVLDAKTVTHIATIFTGSSPQGLSITPDKKFLYVAHGGSTLNSLVAIDLHTLALDSTRTINTGMRVQSVACAPDDVLYILAGGEIYKYNATTKEPVATIEGVHVYSGDLGISPDFSALYYAQFGLSPSKLYKIDLRTNPPTVSSTNSGSNGQSLAISNTGKFVISPNGAPYYISLFSTDYFPGSSGDFPTGAYPRLGAFSYDDSVVYTYNGSSSIGIYSTSTFLSLGTIPLSDETSPTAIWADPSDTLIFIGSENQLLVIGNPLKPVRLQGSHQALDIHSGVFFASFDSFPGRRYALQTSTDLKAWTNMGEVVRGTGESVIEQRTFTASKPRQFFRLTQLELR